jgi:hypothetical protein
MPFRTGEWTTLDRYGQFGTEGIFPAGGRSGATKVQIYGSGAVKDRFPRESKFEPI